MAYWNRNQILRDRARSLSELSQFWQNGNSARDTEVRQPRRHSYHGSMERRSPAITILETGATLTGSVLTQIVGIEDLRSLRSQRLRVPHAYQPADDDVNLEDGDQQDTITLGYFYDQDSADAAVDDTNQLKLHVNRLLESLPKHERNDLTSVTLRLQTRDDPPDRHVLEAAQATQMPMLEATVNFWLAEALSQLRLLCVTFSFGVLDTLSLLNSGIPSIPEFDISEQISQHWWDPISIRKFSDTALPYRQAARETGHHNEEMLKQNHRNSSSQSSVSRAKERPLLQVAPAPATDNEALLDSRPQQSSNSRGNSIAEDEDKSKRQLLLMRQITQTTHAADEAHIATDRELGSDILKEHDDTKILALQLDETLGNDATAVTTDSRSTNLPLTSQLQHNDHPSSIAKIQYRTPALSQRHFVYRLGADFKLVNEINAADFFRPGQILCTPGIVPKNSPDRFGVRLHNPSLGLGLQESSSSLDQTIFIDIQMLVVVRRGPSFCTALPLEPFPGSQPTESETPQGSIKKIRSAIRGPSETPAAKRHIVAHTLDKKLPPNTYLSIGKPQTLEHNLRYKNLGRIDDQDVKELDLHFRSEMKRTGDARDFLVEVREEPKQASKEKKKLLRKSSLKPLFDWI